ncbi:MAG TPA: type IV toxin-antitoxin system AbiEi family antitoxin domain-containing protein [Gryllotalpicola sp.]
MTPDQLLEVNLGIVTRAQLRAAGASTAQLRRALSAGSLVAIGKNVIARPAARAASLRAVAMGGRLACVSAARERGLWVIDDGRFHVAARSMNSHAGPDGRTPPAIVHRTRHPIDPAGDLLAMESVINMLMHVAKCQPLEYAVAVFDSAVRTGQILLDELRQLATVHGGRFRLVVCLTSSQADSGIESITRIRLGAAGIAVREQVKVEGHAVDLLIGERLVIQLDGKPHGKDVQLNRGRWQDRRLSRMGYTVLRYGYAEVLFGWGKVLSEIAAAMAQRLHLR